ncbi:hypothetical protein CBR58_14930 [Bacillus thuringiensis]|uniref:Uncharacterized protein n=1 Tax=Bacillus thuringiensis TaxID=1428 RepID=A0A9X6V8X1_BACTU|nr:hypothetical protein A3L20_04200 [Bacillus thuringiensis]KIP28952.1 sulfurtransferase TusA family protein [Bacillus thuringiensis serovar morrisoni]OTZ25443.1 hypothetical protein BK763_32485 [Bacillus thuringiensis serovar thompsoni]MBG9635566.1 hypothetical protein [Bacillus thuringiensis]MBG9671061.1 hypothetical protein [Bacillus thuringiensis]
MSIKVDMSLDCKGLACPMPIVKTKKAIEGLTPGQVIEVKATDKGSTVDIKSWASKVGHQYIGTKHEGDVLVHYVRKANEHGVTITNVMDTHLHADHISGGRKLAEKVGGTYWLPPKDAEEVVFSYEPLVEGSVITVGGTKIVIDALYSPGHTIGSTSFIVDDSYLLSGDILFVDSIGRPDLAGKAEDWVSDLRNTLYTLYKELSQDLIVLPAHYSKISEMDERGVVSASLQDLFKENVGLNIADEIEFRKAVTENLPPQPNAYEEIRQTNMGKIHPSVEEEREMEIGPNRCAVHESL